MLDYQFLTDSLVFAAVLFALGVVGFVARRNLATVIISSGIMLQAGILAIAAFSKFHANDAGRLFSLFAIGTTFVEFVLLFSLMIVLVRSTGSLDLSRWKLTRAESPEDFAPTPRATIETDDNSGGTVN